MDLYEFRHNLCEETSKRAFAENVPQTVAFTEIATEYLEDADLLADFNAFSFKKMTKRGTLSRIDGYAYDETEKAVNIIVSLFLGTADGNVTPASADALFDGVYQFVDEVLTRGTALYGGSSPVRDLADILEDQKEILTRIRIILLTDATYSLTESQRQRLTNNGIPIDRQVQDIGNIFEAFLADPEKLAIRVNFVDYSGGRGIPCIEALDSINGKFKSFICVIPGNVIADIYDEYGSQLLEGNVRSFLSSKVAVNRQIRATILNEPERFFVYNNGIAATAKNVKTRVTERGLEVISAENFQIINGGQTTASLSNARFKDKADLNRVYVQMKLTELNTDNQDTMDELVRSISKSSNSQNKVSDVDFFATHDFHFRLEKISREVAAPKRDTSSGVKWFYERARGQYNQLQMKMGKAEAAQFVAENPKSQVISKTDFAKYRMSWEMHPDIVSRGAQTCFMSFAAVVEKKWEKHMANYNEDYYRETIAVAVLFKHLETLVSNQDWYENGYRANVVTYSIALLHKLVTEQFRGYELDLLRIWEKQAVPKEICACLPKITRYVFDKITDENRPVMNVTQWCKREECWTAMQKCPIRLPEEIKKCLISEEELRNRHKGTTIDERTKDDVDAQTKVINLGADYWKKVYAFVLEHKGVRISPNQMTALKTATRIPDGYLNSISSKSLLKLLDEVALEGFKE